MLFTVFGQAHQQRTNQGTQQHRAKGLALSYPYRKQHRKARLVCPEEALIEATHGCRLSCNRLILVTSLNGGLPFGLPHPRENHGVVEEEAWVLVVSEPLYARA